MQIQDGLRREKVLRFKLTIFHVDVMFENIFVNSFGEKRTYTFPLVNAFSDKGG